MKIDTLIKALSQIKAEKGDISVLVASDPEGNNYCELGNGFLSVDYHKGKLLIFPEREISAGDIGL